MLEHQQTVGNTDAKGSTGAAFADHRRDDGHPQPEHLTQIHGDGFTLPLLLSLKPCIGPGGVDEAQDREAEAIRMLHQPHGFAVSAWSGHAEVACNVLLGVTPLLMADQQHGLVPKTTDSAHQSLIVVATTITMQFDPVVAEHLNEIQGAGTMRVAGYLNLLSRGQPLEDLLTTAGCQRLQLMELLTDIHLGIPGELTNLFDLLLQFNQRLLKFQ